MNTEKITDTEILAGIDTLQIGSDTESALTKAEAPYITKTIHKDTDSGRYFYKLNPDKANGNVGIYESEVYFNILEYMIEELQLTNPSKKRIDFRFDSFADNFDEMLKLNRILVLLISLEYKVDNRYESIDPLTLDRLCVRVQNDRIEAENYNKRVQEPCGQVYNRLELRSKKLGENANEHDELMKWLKRLDNAVTRENYTALQKVTNTYLYMQYTKEKALCRNISVSEFLYKHESNIFTRKQLIEFFEMLGYSSPIESAKKYKHRKKCEFIRYSDLRLYVGKLKQSASNFFENQDIKKGTHCPLS